MNDFPSVDDGHENNEDPLARYSRQWRFPCIGREGQQKISRSTVVVIGLGALGSTIAELLARAGVGRLRLVDRDCVELSNLQRQSLYCEEDARLGLTKVEAATRRITKLNSQIAVESFAIDVQPETIHALGEGAEILVDATDNFKTRFLINDFALERSLPWVHGGCLGGGGQVFVFVPKKTICFRCLVPDEPTPGEMPTCESAGVFGPAAHAIAAVQAGEVLKFLVSGFPGVLKRLLLIDAWGGRWRDFDVEPLKNQDCPACQGGERSFLYPLKPSLEPLVLCGRRGVQLPASASGGEIALEAIAARWMELGKVQHNRFLVRLFLPDGESITLFRDGRAVITGTEDPARARSLFAKFVGL